MRENPFTYETREILEYPDPMVPISEFIDRFDTFTDRTFLSHWHHELELQIMIQGSAEYYVNGTPYIVGERCAIYIAPETVHTAKALSTSTIGYNVVLLPQFLSRPLCGINCEKYTVPLSTRYPEAYVITPARKEGNAILHNLEKMYGTESSGFAHELFLLEKMIGIWRNLMAIFPKYTSVAQDRGKDLREQRMRAMLDFIRQNYTQPLTMQEIAASANIGKSEAFRCFAALSQTTPVEYVNKMRLMQAAQLLTTTKDSVSEICYQTGFNSASYFSKKFGEYYGMTPKAYRAEHKE